MRLASIALLLVSACSSSSTGPTQASRTSCGPTPEPLTADACFGDSGVIVQTTDPHGPNYVPPGCPCALTIEIPTPDGGFIAAEAGDIPHP